MPLKKNYINRKLKLTYGTESQKKCTNRQIPLHVTTIKRNIMANYTSAIANNRIEHIPGPDPGGGGGGGGGCGGCNPPFCSNFLIKYLT